MKKWVPLTTIKMVRGALKRGGGRLKSPHRIQNLVKATSFLGILFCKIHLVREEFLKKLE